MENQQQENNLFNLQLDNTSRMHIRNMTIWALIMVVVSLISYVIGFIDYYKKKQEIQRIISDEDSPFGFFLKFGGGNSLGGLLFTTIIGLLVTYFLYQFSVKAKKGVENLSQSDLNQGLMNLRNYFMAIGIICIVVAALMLFAMIFVFSFTP
jgi:hypothetical protein